MANRSYGLGLQAFASGSISWGSDNIKINLITNTYVPNFSTDQYLSVIGGGNIVATSANLASKTNVLGAMSAATTTFSGVSGSAASYIGMYKDTGNPSTSPLILLIDTATNLPITPNGGDINVQWGTSIWTLFEGLSESERSLLARLRDWLRGLCIPAELSPGGLYIPAPQVVLA